MTVKLQEILNLFPKTKEDTIPWESLEKTTLSPLFLGMAKTNQHLEYHGEGDVLTHTKMVCEALIKDSEFWTFSERERQILFLSALLHDIGKIKKTRLIDGILSSPHHANAGAVMAREFMWKELGLSGNKEKQEFRESVCALIKYHSYPPFAISNKFPNQKMLKVASVGKIAPEFSIRKLCVLERADINGRISESNSDHLEKIELCKMLAEDLGCIDKPYQFKDEYTERAYHKGKTDYHENQLFNDTWGEIIMLSGLPGTGKDTFIKANYSDLPVITLDDIRKELKILPTDNQGLVVATANERAKELLRRKQPFIWNATNITADIRKLLIPLFEDYGASVRIVFLETEWNEGLHRNSSRQAEVPKHAIEKMLSRLEIPEPFEAQSVEYHIT